MTEPEVQFTALVVGAAWCLAAVAACSGWKLVGAGANMVAGLIIATAALVSLNGLFHRRPLALDHFGSDAGSTVWTVSASPGAWITLVVLVCAVAAICLSFRSREGRRGVFWLGWVLNGPSVLLGVVSAALSLLA